MDEIFNNMVCFASKSKKYTFAAPKTETEGRKMALKVCLTVIYMF